MNQKTKERLAVSVQILIVFFTAWSVGHMYFFTGSGNMRVNGSVIFRYFTVDSNILCAVSCLFSLILTGRKSKAAKLFRYAGTAAVTVTMMTVLLFLGILYGYAAMLSGWNLWLHLLGPILAIISFVWLERDGTHPEKKHLIFAMLPVIIYGVVYLILVVMIGEKNGGWPDFYGFNRGGRWYLSYVIMMAGTALIGVILAKLKSAGRKEQ